MKKERHHRKNQKKLEFSGDEKSAMTEATQAAISRLERFQPMRTVAHGDGSSPPAGPPAGGPAPLLLSVALPTKRMKACVIRTDFQFFAADVLRCRSVFKKIQKVFSI